MFCMALYGFTIISLVKCSTDGSELLDDKFPKCSFFDFQQRLLEKLVRMEMKMDSMEIKINAIENKVNGIENKVNGIEDKVNGIEDQVNGIEDKVDNYKENTEIKLKAISTKTNENKDSLESFKSSQNEINNVFNMEKQQMTTEMTNNITLVEEMLIDRINRTNTKLITHSDELRQNFSKEMTDTKNLMSELNKAIQIVSSTKAVVFKASGLVRDTDIKGITLQFKTVSVNIGGAYNSATGIFTAPTQGTYFFSVQACVEANKKVELLIKVNGSKLIGIIIYKNNNMSGAECVTGDGVSTLAVGDKVSVVSAGKTSDGDVLISANGYSSLSGFLLKS